MTPDFDSVAQAARRLEGYAVKTPLIEHSKLNALTGGRILIKAECLQRTGSFKFRGAWNRISQLDPAKHPGGVVAFSSGNHAQGVAAAAEIKGLPALIVMPADTPAIKIGNTRSYGAEVVAYDRLTEDREAIARRIAADRNAVLVPPYDDADIIAGQGTCGKEIAEEAAARGLDIDDMIVCASGGGLMAGIAIALEKLSPKTRLWSAEPRGHDDHARSFKAGARQRNSAPPPSICDALMSPEPGQITFPVTSRRAAGGLSASDDEVRAAMRFAFETLKLVIEPGGAVALAAVLQGRIETKGRTVALTASGGNVDARLFAEILGG